MAMRVDFPLRPFSFSLATMTRQVLLCAGLVLLLAFVAAPSVPDVHAQDANDKVYDLSNYDVSLTLHPDGTLDVRETIRLDVQRGTFTTMYRDVDGDRLDSLTNISVTSNDVSVENIEIDEGGNDTEIRWSYPPLQSAATFEISYRAHGGLRIRDEVNVLKWMAVGTKWDVPIRDIDVRLILPAQLRIPRDSLTVTPEDATVRTSGGGWEIQASRANLEAGEGYAIETTFPARIDAPEAFTLEYIAGGLVLFLLSVTSGGYAAHRRFKSTATPISDNHREPSISLPEAARTLSAVRAARTHNAMLFDLARRGHVSFRVDEETSWGVTSSTVHVDVHMDRSGLDAFEHAFLSELSQYETLDDVTTDMISFRKEQRTEIRKRLVQRGWLYDRTAERNRYVILSAICLLIGIGALIFGIREHLVNMAYGFGLFFGAGLGLLFLVDPQFAHTETGDQKRTDIQAYLDHVRSDMERLRDNAPAEAANRLPDLLPWLLLDSKISATWFKKLATALDEAGYADRLPPWLVPSQSTGNTGFLVLTTLIATSSSANGAATVGGGGVAGAGGAGAAGGGGGGAG